MKAMKMWEFAPADVDVDKELADLSEDEREYLKREQKREAEAIARPTEYYRKLGVSEDLLGEAVKRYWEVTVILRMLKHQRSAIDAKDFDKLADVQRCAETLWGTGADLEKLFASGKREAQEAFKAIEEAGRRLVN